MACFVAGIVHVSGIGVLGMPRVAIKHLRQLVRVKDELALVVLVDKALTTCRIFKRKQSSRDIVALTKSAIGYFVLGGVRSHPAPLARVGVPQRNSHGTSALVHVDELFAWSALPCNRSFFKRHVVAGTALPTLFFFPPVTVEHHRLLREQWRSKVVGMFAEYLPRKQLNVVLRIIEHTDMPATVLALAILYIDRYAARLDKQAEDEVLDAFLPRVAAEELDDDAKSEHVAVIIKNRPTPFRGFKEVTKTHVLASVALAIARCPYIQSGKETRKLISMTRMAALFSLNVDDLVAVAEEVARSFEWHYQFDEESNEHLEMFKLVQEFFCPCEIVHELDAAKYDSRYKQKMPSAAVGDIIMSNLYRNSRQEYMRTPVPIDRQRYSARKDRKRMWW